MSQNMFKVKRTRERGFNPKDHVLKLRSSSL